jgi:uncharacterized protein YcbX
MQPVGVIRQLGRYPVKSMCGASTAETTLTLQGGTADRRYGFLPTASRRLKEDPLRFRPNLLADLDGEALKELNWVGRILRAGCAARIAITQVDTRHENHA